MGSISDVVRWAVVVTMAGPLALVGTPAWFQLSIIPFALGILRYALLLDQDEGEGAPEELVLSDPVLLAIGAVWVLSFAVAVHGG